MKGRKPKPSELHQLEKGKLYGEVAARVENTPKSRRDLRPRCPQWLTSSQRKIWRHYAKILKNYGMFTAGNQAHLNYLAIYEDGFKKSAKKITQGGFTMLTENGFEVQTANFTIMNRCFQNCMKILSELGLSSTGLARIGSLVAGAAKKKSEMEELID